MLLFQKVIKNLRHLSSPGVTPPDHQRPTLRLGRTTLSPSRKYQTSSPAAPVYMVLQPAARTATPVTSGTGGLLHHLFTLTLRRLFSVTVTQPHGRLPVSQARRPCVARTFLSRLTAAAAEPLCYIFDGGLESSHKTFRAPKSLFSDKNHDRSVTIFGE